jgi:hypothetical protein
MKEAKDQRCNQFKPLTAERLLQFDGLANLSDDEAKRIIESLDQLCRIIFAYWQKKRP